VLVYDRRMVRTRWTRLLALALATLPIAAAADPTDTALVPRAGLLAAHATLARPLRLPASVRHGAPAPHWSAEGLWRAAPRDLFGLAAAARPGIAVYDPSSRRWYASASGCLVEVRPDRTLPVLLDNVQGIDVDVRAAAGVAVSREPDHTIVLHRLGAAASAQGGGRRVVLLRGSRYFRPRLSPDGTKLLVSESRAGGGHLWRFDLAAADAARGAVDLGEGSGGAWRPDSRHVIFAAVLHDGHRITDSDLWQVDTMTRTRTLLARTPAVHELEPAISPDGQRLAFVDARTGALMIAALAAVRP
jgi:hypothetical protein